MTCVQEEKTDIRDQRHDMREKLVQFGSTVRNSTQNSQKPPVSFSYQQPTSFFKAYSHPSSPSERAKRRTVRTLETSDPIRVVLTPNSPIKCPIARKHIVILLCSVTRFPPFPSSIRTCNHHLSRKKSFLHALVRWPFGSSSVAVGLFSRFPCRFVKG